MKAKKTIEKITNFQCTECGRFLCHQQSLDSHMKNIHSITLEKPKKLDQLKKNERHRLSNMLYKQNRDKRLISTIAGYLEYQKDIISKYREQEQQLLKKLKEDLENNIIIPKGSAKTRKLNQKKYLESLTDFKNIDVDNDILDRISTIIHDKAIPKNICNNINNTDSEELHEKDIP